MKADGVVVGDEVRDEASGVVQAQLCASKVIVVKFGLPEQLG